MLPASLPSMTCKTFVWTDLSGPPPSSSLLRSFSPEDLLPFSDISSASLWILRTAPGSPPPWVPVGSILLILEKSVLSGLGQRGGKELEEGQKVEKRPLGRPRALGGGRLGKERERTG